MYFKLKEPQITEADVNETLALIPSPPEKIMEFLRASEDPQYGYWDTLRHKAEALGLKPEIAWLFVDYSRTVSSRTYSTPVRTEAGDYFEWHALTRFDAFFHEVDMSLGGLMKIAGVDLDERHKQEFITRGVMEEAIASAQLEGANTARKVAKKMLLEGRRPGTKSEKMIVNNYKAMKLVEEEYKNSALSLELLLHLHEVLTIDTLDDENDCGRLRTGDDDDVRVVDGAGVIYHTGLNPEFVKRELDRLIAYANQAPADARVFTHPVVKAVILHFWVGYLHPFVDGNGRLARTLFYWSLLRDGYWGFTYLPISKVIKNSDTQYGMAYVYTEQDKNDFTYFLDYNVRKIELALKNFREYAARKAREQKALRSNLSRHNDLNDRQIRVLQYLHAESEEFITTRSFQTVNDISGPTAAKDVKEMVVLGYLEKRKNGRQVKYYPTDNIKTLFKA